MFQAPLSVQKRYAGRTDVPLTEVGLTQAAAAAKRLVTAGIDAIVASPLQLRYRRPRRWLRLPALLAPPPALYRMHLDVTALCEIDWYADDPAVLRSYNDTAHLSH